MIAMAIAISILAGAMKTVAELDWEGIAKGLVGIAGMTAIIVVKVMPKAKWVRDKSGYICVALKYWLLPVKIYRPLVGM